MSVRAMLLSLMLLLAGCEFGQLNSTARNVLSSAPTPDPRLPYPIPGSCPQTNALVASTLPDEFQQLTDFWIGENTILAGHVDGPAWHVGENNVVWFSRGGQPQVELLMIENRKAPAVSVKFQEPQPLQLYPSTINLPLGGCWQISATAGAFNLVFMVFAYPSRVTR